MISPFPLCRICGALSRRRFSILRIFPLSRLGWRIGNVLTAEWKLYLLNIFRRRTTSHFPSRFVKPLTWPPAPVLRMSGRPIWPELEMFLKVESWLPSESRKIMKKVPKEDRYHPCTGHCLKRVLFEVWLWPTMCLTYTDRRMPTLRFARKISRTPSHFVSWIKC